MKIFRLTLLFILIYVIQITMVSRIAVYGVRADLPLIFLTLVAVTFGAENGAVAGIICGLVQDIFGSSFYIHTISRGFLGLIVGTFKESVFGTEETVAFTAVFVASVTNFILELVLLFFFFGRPLASVLVLFTTLVLSCLLNSIFAPLVFKLVKMSSSFIMAEE